MLTSYIKGHVDIPPSSLMEDMKKMFDCPLGSDIKLVASDSRVIHAHKIILATRSEAFRFIQYIEKLFIYL